ncbi:GNAT family N-acetyltransferase [Dyadobacter fanqingshengii]|uniref:GNAT family N-acetyltransferase n=1 Tax=Dyadobacter fanqingshengii TaxID=2906443 RepID=A0A9X1TBI2_9BACT|nr:GNAT family N-acetyltransferase [Dyadobacter fanqingshengii]MCF0042876.1 GNAT family N-acetyltransferase [Dyadobacter fanqingshengii]USJ35432.1 GNAT family N-acetyltransferase [Dyadobacter fanqingshengii]
MILTPNLRIVPCDDTLFDAIRMGNNTLARVMGVNVPKKWTEFRDTFTPSYHRWKAHPPLRDWWVYLIIHVPDNILIGSCGYKGEPDANGMVEIGYEIMSSYRSKGLGAETAKGLTAHAFGQPGVHKVVAHTLREENASVKILEKIGFKQIEDINDPDDGPLWRWELARK